MSQDDVFIFVFDVLFVYLLCIICTVIVLSSNLYLLIAFNKLWLLHSFYLLIPEYEQRVARGAGCSEHPEVSFAARHNSIKAHFFAVKRTLFYSKKMTLNDNHWRTLNDVRLSKKSAWACSWTPSVYFENWERSRFPSANGQWCMNCIATATNWWRLHLSSQRQKPSGNKERRKSETWRKKPAKWCPSG